MAGVQSVWGIDVGRCALKAIKLRAPAEGQVELLAHDYVEHAKILSLPDADGDELIANSLERFLSRNDISNAAVVVSVPGQQTLARFTKLPPVDPKKIPDIVRYEADQQIPFNMDEVIWDYQTFEQEDLPDVEVGIFAMKRELIRGHLLHFEQAGIEPIAVQSGPLAVFNAAHREQMLGSDTTILLDIGAESTDLIIATPHSLWTRSIHIGGNRFTEALVKSFKLSFSKAENLKRTAASSRYARQIFQAMRPVFADLVQDLQRSIGFYSSTHRDARIEKVIGFGNACKLPGLQKYLQQNLGFPVEQRSSFKALESSASASAPQFSDNVLSFAVSYGLGLQGLQQAKVTSNLLPLEIAKQVVWRKKRPFLAAAAACLVLAGMIVWARYTWDLSALAAGRGSQDLAAVSEAEAARIIDDGPGGGLAYREEARRVEAAAGKLKSIYNGLQGDGEAELEATKDFIDLQRGKAKFPRILALIHDALPTSDDPYAQARTSEEALAAVQTGEVPPRAQRREIVITEMNVEHRANIHRLVFLNPKESKFKVDFGVEEEWPGFFIEIICTSAHEGKEAFIEKEFLAKLREAGFQPGLGFIFNRVYLGERMPVRFQRRTSSARSGSRPGPRGSATASSRPSSAGLAYDNLDLVTLEPRRNEWEYRIQIAVVLEDAQFFLDEDAQDDEGG